MKTEIEVLFAAWVHAAEKEATVWEAVRFLPQPPKAWLKAMQLAENARRAFELAAARQGGHTAR
jgi:hypothetical protein